MFKRHYLIGVLVFLSLAAGSAATSAAETGIKTRDYVVQSAAYRDPHRPFYGYRRLYDYAGPRAGYGFNP
jgi:hypothetical protein